MISTVITPDIKRNIGQMLRQLRKSRVMTVQEASVESGLAYYTIEKAEANIRVTPRILMKLSQVYNVSYDALMEEAGVEK